MWRPGRVVGDVRPFGALTVSRRLFTYRQVVSYELTSPVSVAVLGSCVSRDLFNSKFNPHYKDLFDCVALSNQVSLVSLMSEAIDIPNEMMAELDAYSRGEVAKEASRSFLADLVSLRPEYLIIDLFADVHFGVFQVDDRYLTRNRWKIMKARFYADAQKVDLIPERDPDAYLEVWRESVDRLFHFLADKLPDTRVILHRARNVTHSSGPDGAVRSLGREPQIRAMNEWWDRLDAELTERGVIRQLDLYRDDLTSFDAHPWGPFAVHYTLDYHAAALSKLTQIVLSDARRRPCTGDNSATVAPARPTGGRRFASWNGLRAKARPTHV